MNEELRDSLVKQAKLLKMLEPVRNPVKFMPGEDIDITRLKADVDCMRLVLRQLVKEVFK